MEYTEWVSERERQSEQDNKTLIQNNGLCSVYIQCAQ